MNDLHIRWMIRRDMPEVHAIENASFELPWTEDDFIRALRNRNVIGMVAEHHERIVGHMIYELHKDGLEILNLAVHPEHRYSGIGTAMMRKLKGKLSAARRKRLKVIVREANLDAQLFFKAVGFRAIAVLREFETTGEDAYVFQFHVRALQGSAQ